MDQKNLRILKKIWKKNFLEKNLWKKISRRRRRREAENGLF